MIKKIRATAFGGAEVLTLHEEAPAAVGANEVRIEVEAVGVGFVDVMQRSGAYPGVEPNFVPGLEVAGHVTEVGSAVSPDIIDKRVFTMVAGGGYAQQVVAPAALLVPLPDSLGASEAVALGVNAAVAYRCADISGVTKGQNVLVRGASGGIGVHAVQTASDRGAEVTVVTSSEERGQRLRRLGASHVVDRTSGVLPDDTRFDVIIDPVGGADVSAMLNALAPNGRYVLCGAAAGFPAPDFGLGLLLNFQSSPTISAVSLSSLGLEELLDIYAAVFGAFAEERIAPIIADVLPLADAAEAHRRIEAGEVFGKIILKP